jgi:two-component system, cell cycle sensor histidine kinase and response regulator CckA
MASLRILHLEDNELDGEFIRMSLDQADIASEITRVETRDAFLTQIHQQHFDLIVSDFSLPSFDGLSALRIVREKKLDTPFIFVSGTIGEERAVAALRDGATDYVLKDRLSRLPEAIRRCVAERQEREARQAAEERIHEQAALLDEAREAIVVHDLDRRVTFWNRGAERLYGWTAAEAKAGAASAMLTPESRTLVSEAITIACKGGAWDGTLNIDTRDGRRLVVESHWTCLRQPNGVPRAILTISRDVTQERQMEAQLQQKQRLETIGMVAGGIAHDLNNVLAPIVLGIGSLRRKVTDEHGLRLLQTMDSTAHRGAEILQQVLSFARGTQRPAGPVDIGEVIRGMERLLAATLSSNIELSIEIAPDLRRPRVDAAQLQQVLLNLCVNARDAMPGAGRLSIRAENGTPRPGDVGEHVVLQVTDSGTGMPEEVRRKIFDPFYTTKATGTGIGLATVLSIVKRHGGSIEVDSVVGQGTEFRVRFPVSDGPSTGSFPVVSATGGGRLLVIVDEGSIREIARQTLEAYGYRVLCPNGPDELRRVLGEQGPEIAAAVVNVSLPDVDAPALIRDLARRAPAAKVIATTRTLEDPAKDAVSLAATLAQPYTPQKLLETVGRLLS